MGETTSMLELLMRANQMALTIPSHSLLGLPHPGEVAQLAPPLQEVIRTKVAQVRSWNQFNAATFMNYEAELKAFRALVEGQLILRQRGLLMGDQNHGG
jgi:hypothetical protein